LLSYRERRRILEEERLRRGASKEPPAPRSAFSRFSFVNEPIFLWFLTTVLIGTYSAVSSAKNECTAKQSAEALNISHLRTEIAGRMVGIVQAAAHNDLAGALKQQGHEADYSYLDYRYRTLKDLTDEYLDKKKSTYDITKYCSISISAHGIKLREYNFTEYFTEELEFKNFLGDPSNLIDRNNKNQSVDNVLAAYSFSASIPDSASWEPAFIRNCGFWDQLLYILARLIQRWGDYRLASVA
jgi:hypothetical protein